MISATYTLQRKVPVLAAFFAMIYAVPLFAQSTCPDIQINFNIPAVVCFDVNNSIVDLEVEINGGNGTGTGQWSGTHITNSTTGFFRTTFATPGPQQVIYTYTEDMCTYRDTTTFLYARPSPLAFQASSEQAGRLCQDSFSVLRVLSNYDSTTTKLVWDFAGGTAEAQGRPDSLHLTWDTPGSKLIRLQAEQFGCLSQPIIQQVVLDPVIDTPIVACDNTLESVVYEWEDPPNSSATIVFVITGPNGVADTVEDRYTIENLMPGQIVQVRMVTTSENTCDGNFIDPICQSVSCDGNLIDINPIESVCISSGMTDTIDLDYLLYDTLTPSTLTWSGAGVFDPDQARIAIDPSMAGQTQWVYVKFESANCTVRDSVSFELIPPPLADFSLTSTVCQGDIADAEFTAGTLLPDSDTLLLWDFGDAEIISTPETGQVSLSWATSGSKTVGLALQRGACVSDTIYRTVDVQAGAAPVQITCTPGPNGVVFSWQDIPGADFEVRVLEGPTGTRLSDTSYEISGLSANQNASIEVTTNVAGPCSAQVATASCLPIDCSNVSISIEDIPPVCLSANTVPINLEAMITGGGGTGILSWRGPKVSGSSWLPDSSLAGQQVVLHAEYREGSCFYEDSLEVVVSELISADFELAAQICSGSPVDLTFTGRAPADADFGWSPDSLLGMGPHTLVFNQAGIQRIGLVVESNGCSSELLEKTIEVLDPYPDPVITCDSGLEEVVFSWKRVEAMRQEIVYSGPGTGTLSSDTTFRISGLTPGIAVRIEVQFIDDSFSCRNAYTTAECSTNACDKLSIDWSAPDFVCRKEPFTIAFTTQGAGTEGFDLAIRQGTQTSTYRGITNGTTLTFEPDAGTTFTLISAGIPGNTSCAVALPGPLEINLNTAAEAGSQISFPAICEQTDTSIMLADLLDQVAPDGQWSFRSGPDDPDIAFDPDLGILTTAQLGPGRYLFQYQVDTNSHCTSDSALVAVDILPGPLADAGPDVNLDCQFNIASLGSNLTTPDMIYRWDGPSSNALADPFAPITEVTLAGLYTLTVLDPSNSCEAADEVTVTASPDMITPYVRVSPISCFGESDGIIFIDSIAGGQEPYLFSLNGIDQGSRSVFPNLPAGNYDLQISSGNGCEATALLKMDAPVEMSVQLTTDLERTANNTITAGDSVQITALVNIPADQIADIIWSHDPVDQAVPLLTQMVRPQITSSFGVEVIDFNGCSAQDRISIIVQRNNKVFIPNAFSPNQDGNNDIFYIQTDHHVQQISQFRVYNRWGRQLFVNQNFQPNDPAEGWNGETRSLPQPAGVYIYQAEMELASGETLLMSGDITLLR